MMDRANPTRYNRSTWPEPRLWPNPGKSGRPNCSHHRVGMMTPASRVFKQKKKEDSEVKTETSRECKRGEDSTLGAYDRAWVHVKAWYLLRRVAGRWCPSFHSPCAMEGVGACVVLQMSKILRFCLNFIKKLIYGPTSIKLFSFWLIELSFG